VLADDSGLEVAALAWEPGVDTADLLVTATGRDDRAGMARLQEMVRDAGPAPAARFVATVIYLWGPDDWTRHDGCVEGHLCWPPRGAQGHGFDPMFVPAGMDRTCAELDAAEKLAVSHRGRAIASFARAWLQG
jgi:XTP/dITP diphosphohydrolase